MTSGPRKPGQLPRSFRPQSVEWRPLSLPTPKLSGAYVPRSFAKKSLGWVKSKLTQSARATPQELLIPTQHTRVWVCDAEAPTRELLEQTLREWKFEVEAFGDASEALSRLDSQSSPHVMVVGAQCGTQSGMELVQQWMRRVPDGEFVYVGTAESLLAGRVHDARSRLPSLVLHPLTQLEEFRSVIADAVGRVHSKLYSEFLVEQLDRQQLQLETEEHMAGQLAQVDDPAQVMDLACRGLSKLFDGSPVLFLRYHVSQNSIEVVYRWPAQLFAGAFPRLMLPSNGAQTFAQVSAFLEQLEKDSGFQLMIQQARALDGGRESSAEEGGFWYGAPMTLSGVPYGAFAVFSRDWNETADRFRLRRAVFGISKHFEIAQLRQRLSESTIQDPVTGLSHLNFFKNRLSEEIQKAQRLRHPLSLLWIRVLPGQTAGRDLKGLVRLLKSSFRGTDLLTASGESTFEVLLPHTSFADAIVKAEWLRRHVHETSEGQEELAIGVAECPGHADGVEGLRMAAREASEEASGAAVMLSRVPESYLPPYLPELARPLADKFTP